MISLPSGFSMGVICFRDEVIFRMFGVVRLQMMLSIEDGLKWVVSCSIGVSIRFKLLLIPAILAFFLVAFIFLWSWLMPYILLSNSCFWSEFKYSFLKLFSFEHVKLCFMSSLNGVLVFQRASYIIGTPSLRNIFNVVLFFLGSASLAKV